MNRLEKAEALGKLMHQLVLHVLDGLVQYGDVEIDNLASKWYKPWWALDDEDKTYFQGWGFRALNLAEALRDEGSEKAEESP